MSKGEETRERVLKAINKYMDEHQYPPSLREVGAMVGLRSVATVQGHVLTLIKTGQIETDHGIGASRALRVPDRMKRFDELYLAKCQEVNELRAQIDDLIELLCMIESEIVCEELSGWDCNKELESWCGRNCGKRNGAICASEECYKEYVKMKAYYCRKKKG